MRSPTHHLLFALALATTLAPALPAAAEERRALLPSDEASCRVPQPGDPAPAVPRANLDDTRIRLAGEGPKAVADGVVPLNTTGYNYRADRAGLDPAALDFEARGR